MKRVKGHQTIIVTYQRITDMVQLTQQFNGSIESKVEFPPHAWEEVKKQIQAEIDESGAAR